MEKNRIIIKTSILLLMFILACSFFTKAYAVTDIESATSFSAIQTALTTGDGKISLNYGDAVKNKYIFCRDQAKELPQNREFVYSMDGNAVTYPKNDKSGAAWAYLFGKNFNKASTINFSDGRLQNLFWNAINGNETYFSNHNSLQNPENDAEIAEAKAYGEFIYGEFILSGKKINKDSFTKEDIKVPTNLMMLTVPEQSPNPNTYGPFSIDCDYWEYNNELKAGISEFYVYATDTDGNTIQPSYRLIYDDVKVAENFEKYMWHGPWENNVIPFTYENEKIYGNEQDNEMIKLNQVCADPEYEGFYIQIDQPLQSISIKVKYKYIDASLDLIPIKVDEGSFSPYQEWCTCDEHKGYTFVDGKGTNKNYIYVENGKLYKFKGYRNNIYRRYDIVEITGEGSGTYINSSNGHSKINVPKYFTNHYPNVSSDKIIKYGSYYPGVGYSPLILGHVGEAPTYNNTLYWMYYANWQNAYTNSYAAVPYFRSDRFVLY